MFNILIAEDDIELLGLYKHVLVKHGYRVTEAHDGEAALKLMEQKSFDLLITDIMMPKLDGNRLAEALRSSGDKTPILTITAKDAFDDMRLGFLSGADDYMVKPINVNEMVLRVGALLRRAKSLSERKVTLGKTTLEMDTFSVVSEDERLILPQKEFMLLYKMASFPDRIFTRQQLMDDIWGYDSESDAHTVEVHIARLREKLRSSRDIKIVTMRGVGYKVSKL